MAVINKDKYLGEIASLVRKGSVSFEMEDRPGFMMSGKQLYVSSVSFDTDSGELVYGVSRGDGAPAMAARPLSGLDIRTLGSVTRAVRKAAGLRRGRERDIMNIESRVAEVTRKSPLHGGRRL